MTDPCATSIGPDGANWSFTTAAVSFAQLIGVLAAVAFAGVILIAQAREVSESRSTQRFRARALGSLLFTFFALVVSAFLYSIISGETLCHRIAAESLMASALFAIASSCMFLSICWLTAAYLEETILWLVKLIASTISVIAVAYTGLTIDVSARAIDPQSVRESDFLWWGVIPLLVTVLAGLTLTAVGPIRRWLTRNSSSVFVCTLLGSIAVAVAGVCAFAYLGVTYPGPASIPPLVRSITVVSVSTIIILHLANLASIQKAKRSERDFDHVSAEGETDQATDQGNACPAPLVKINIVIGHNTAPDQ